METPGESKWKHLGETGLSKGLGAESQTGKQISDLQFGHCFLAITPDTKKPPPPSMKPEKQFYPAGLATKSPPTPSLANRSVKMERHFHFHIKMSFHSTMEINFFPNSSGRGEICGKALFKMTAFTSIKKY